MNLFELAKTITVKVGGNEQDFIDYLIIIRKWLDINYNLHEDLDTDLNISLGLTRKDERFRTLRHSILRKPKHTKKPRQRVPSQYSYIYKEIMNKQKTMLTKFTEGEES